MKCHHASQLGLAASTLLTLSMFNPYGLGSILTKGLVSGQNVLANLANLLNLLSGNLGKTPLT